MPTKRFLVLLLLFFVGAFWWAGGNSITKYSPNFSINSDKVISSSNQVYRALFLKTAVAAKINKNNWVKLNDIPLPMQQALIAVEDNKFYHHYGFDVEGIFRAFLVNLQSGDVVEGGSTITQQLVKNLFLSPEQTMTRKIEEFILAIDMEMNYSKEEIYEMYLNTIYFGSGAYGIKDASKVYFGKTTQNLNLAEASLLAGITNAPSLYSPYENLTAAKNRQAIVLSVMSRRGYISPSLANETKQTPLKFAR